MPARYPFTMVARFESWGLPAGLVVFVLTFIVNKQLAYLIPLLVPYTVPLCPYGYNKAYKLAISSNAPINTSPIADSVIISTIPLIYVFICLLSPCYYVFSPRVFLHGCPLFCYHVYICVCNKVYECVYLY